MNTETSTNPFPTTYDQTSGTGSSSGSSGLNGGTVNLHKAAQKIHEAVDTLEHKIGQGSDKVISLQHEYGDAFRQQVRANPLAAVGISFAVGYVFAKIFGR